MSKPTLARRYRMKRPCPHCPFRTDVEPFLHAERAREIAESLQDGGEFYCHETTEVVETLNDDGEEEELLMGVSSSAVCAGSLIVMEKQGYVGQLTRISERLGMYDSQKMKMDAPVYESLGAWVEAYAEIPYVIVDGERLEYEHCGVVGAGCEDPPGYGVSGGIAYNVDEPTCHPVDDSCHYCGSLMCQSCRSDNEDNVCVACAEDFDQEEGSDGPE